MDEDTDTMAVLERVKQECRDYLDDAEIEDKHVDTALLDFIVGAKAVAGPGPLAAALEEWFDAEVGAYE